MDLKNKKILVTGGAGFIGSHLVNYLIKEGAKVSIIDNLSTGLESNINKKANFYKCDIASKKVKKIFIQEKPEIVYLLACNTNVPKSVQDPMFDIKSLNGNLNIIINSQKNLVKKIIMSSSGFIYGNTNHLPAKESQKTNPDNPYIITKSASENYLKFFNKAYKQNFVILRYSTVYGPKQIKGAMADYIRCIKKINQLLYMEMEKKPEIMYI